MKRAARLRRLAHDLQQEAEHWTHSPRTQEEILRAGTQLVRLASTADVTDPEHFAQIDAFEEAATNLLVSLMSDRAFHALARGVAP